MPLNNLGTLYLNFCIFTLYDTTFLVVGQIYREIILLYVLIPV